MNNEKNISLEYYIEFFLYATTFIFCIIAIRLFYLQIILNNELFTRACKNYTQTINITAQRGNILDCNGNLLATNCPVTQLLWQGTGNKQLNIEQYNCAQFLYTIVQPPYSLEDWYATIARAEHSIKKTVLATPISHDQLSKIIEKYPAHPNIFIKTHIERFYPHKQLACHVLGYINSFVNEGKMGLEKLFEHTLRGQEGKLIRMINSIGKHLSQQEIKQAHAGNDIKTTIDLTMQLLAESVFDQQSHDGALIIVDPKTGAIKALVSRPGFDPHIFLRPISTTEWQLLQEKKPFLNRALHALYPPASIFKLITLAAALEHAIISPDTIIECRGSIKFLGRVCHCAKRSGHGNLSLIEAIAQSCNILFYEIGKQLSIDSLADYAWRFGLGQKTNIIFSEQEGLVPTSIWKQQVKGEPWWPGETLNITIGQGFLLVTPLQIAYMISSIFTGYRVTPRIVEDEPIKREPLLLQPSTLKFLKKAMKAVVKQGTGSKLNMFESLKIYAKTGTAQISSLKSHFNQHGLPEHAWFVAHIEHKSKNPIVLVILVEHVGTSRAATSIAKNFLARYQLA